jgi:hypothetical protein
MNHKLFSKFRSPIGSGDVNGSGSRSLMFMHINYFIWYSLLTVGDSVRIEVNP